MSELKHCPFCGGEAWIRISDAPQILRIECRRCHVATTSFVADSIGEKEAAAAWNTRHVETCRNVNKEWGKTSFAHAGTSFCCSECGAHYVDAESYYAGLADKDEEQIRTNYCPNCGREVK